MAHVINRQEPGPLLWATRLHCLEGHLEQWQLWTPGDTQLVVVSHSEMAHIEPSGQLVRWRLAAQPSAPVGLPTQGIAVAILCWPAQWRGSSICPGAAV